MADKLGEKRRIPKAPPPSQQLLFDCGAPEGSSAIKSPLVPPPETHISSPQSNLRDRVEQYLKRHGVFYVNVREIKRSIKSGTGLSIFHFVVDGGKLHGWLIWAAKASRKVRCDLADWEAIFGEGYKSVLASERKDGELIFQTLDDRPVSILESP